MKLRIVLVAALIAGFATANARNLTEVQKDSLAASTKIITLDGSVVKAVPAIDDDVKDKIGAFLYDQFRNAQDPGAPYFMFMSKDTGLIMGIGGVIRMRGWYDWGGAVPARAFIPYTIPIPKDRADMNRINATPAGTALFFRLIGENRLFGSYQGYIEAGFSGYDNVGFKLKKAYVMWRDFTVGYAPSTFTDPAAESPILDSGSASNKMDHTTVLFRYMPRLARHVLAAVSVENPDPAVSSDGVETKARNAYIPDFAAFVQYDWGYKNSQHVRLSGIVRSLPYRDLLTQKNYNKTGWGVQLSSVFNPIESLTVYATTNYGAGYAGMGGDLLNGSYDLVADPYQHGRLYAPRAFGWNVGVQYNFRPNLYSSVMVSEQRYLPSKPVSPDEFKYGMMGLVNVVWNPVPRVQIGAEIDLGKRMNFSGERGYGRRATLVAQLQF